MSQAVFKDPFVSSAPILVGTGNGTLTVDRLTHFTIDQTYTVTCTAIAPFTVFTVVGNLDGPVGVAVVGTQFYDQDLKVFLTIQQGPTLFVIGDAFTFTVAQGTDLNQDNIDTYDHLPQKNFSAGTEGVNSGNDNLRFQTVALFAELRLQDLLYTSLLIEELGNQIKIEYENTSVAAKAELTIQDITWRAFTAGSAGNAYSVEYEDFDPAVAAELIFGGTNGVGFQAQTPGFAGNSITVEITGGAPTSTPVVSVISLAITVQIQSGISTADQVKNAVNAFPAASALVFSFSNGLGTATQTTHAVDNLSGGLDAVGEAGDEVVTLTVNAILVKFENGVSTATQIKTKADLVLAGLVDVIISGVGSNPQAAPVAETFLSGGADSLGAPGFEVVTVDGTRITVGFQSGINTAQNIKDAIDGYPAAAALVSVSIPGSASNPQTAPDGDFLSGGTPADQWAFNINELSLPLSFFDGSGNLLLNRLIVQGDAYFRKDVEIKGILSLDDFDADDNESGPSIPNVQKAFKNLFQNDKIFLSTQDNQSIQWTVPDLSFESNIIIFFEDTGRFNRILTSESPITLADGESIYVTLDRLANSNLTPVVAATIPEGQDIFRLATRVGSGIYFYDNTFLGNYQMGKFGQSIDLTPQIFSLLEGGGTISISEDDPGEINWSNALKVRPLGSSAEITIFSDTINLADGEVAYIELDDPIVTTSKPILIADRSDVVLNRLNTFWIFHRYGSTVVMRGNGSLEPGEEITIDQGNYEVEQFFSQLQLRPETPNSKRAVITGADISLLDGRRLSQEMISKLMSFDGAVIDFETGEVFEEDGSTPLGVDFTPATIPAGEYWWYAVGLSTNVVLADNTVSVQVAVNPASASGTTPDNAPKADFTGSKKIGEIYVQEDSGSIFNISNANIRQLGIGSGGGGGTLEVDDEGTQLDTAVSLLDFVGSGVVATQTSPGNIEINIPGAGYGGLTPPIIVQETPSGSVTGTDGTDGNANFVLSQTPYNDESILVLLDGTAIDEAYWSLTGSTITFTSGSIPILGQNVYVVYIANGASTIQAVQEVPTGSVTGTDGTDGNTTFVLSGTPFYQNSIIVFVDGIAVKKTEWNFLQGATNKIIFLSGSIPIVGQSVYVYYLINVVGPNTGTGAMAVYGTIGTPETITAAGGITAQADQRQLHIIKSSGGAVTVTATPQISVGTIIGQELELDGTSDTNYINLSDGNGLSLNGAISMKENNYLSLYWRGDVWRERNRR